MSALPAGRARAIVALTAAAALMAGAGCSAGPRAAGADTAAGRIVSVADGDTVTVRLDPGPTRRVRILAMDSPETYATRYGSPEECGAQAASAFMERFDGRRVVLVPDPTQDQIDAYGRLLRYVDLPDGTDLGAAAVARGLAMPYLFDIPARRYRRYRRLAEAARAAGRGTWGPPCGGDFHSSVPGIQDGL